MKFTLAALDQMSLSRLVELFELTETMTGENVPTVRGWLMDAIERRNPAGFDAWLDNEDPADGELRRYVL